MVTESDAQPNHGKSCWTSNHQQAELEASSGLLSEVEVTLKDTQVLYLQLVQVALGGEEVLEEEACSCAVPAVRNVDDVQTRSLQEDTLHYFLTLPFSDLPDLQKSSTHDVAAAVRLGQGQQSHQRVALPRQRPQVADALAGRKPSVAFLRTFTANTGGQSQESSPSQNSRSHPVLQISQNQPHKPSHTLSKHTEQAKRESSQKTASRVEPNTPPACK